MSGPTGATGATGPAGADLSMFPAIPTRPSESTHIVTLEELMSSHGVIVAKEAEDTQALKSLTNPPRDSLRPQMFQWAAAGFPDLYLVQSFTVTPPDICADGVKRDFGSYLEYCIGTNLGEVINGMKTLMPGIQPSWSISGNTLRIHVSRI